MLSVVIPTLDEAHSMGRCLNALFCSGGDLEVIVCDGGSVDGTQDLAKKHGVKVIECRRGLVQQCNQGARATSGDILFFLAADCVLGDGWDQRLLGALQSPYVAGGGFSLCVEGNDFLCRLVTFGGNFRSKYFGITLPDQGLFVRRRYFEELSGFSESSTIPFAQFSLDLKRYGEFLLLDEPLLSSPRKWRRDGFFRTIVHHQRTFLRFLTQ